MQAVENVVSTAINSAESAFSDLYTAFTWDKQSMRDLTDWTTVVVGGTDGVGYEAAKAFTEHVVLVGRNKDKIERYVSSCAEDHDPQHAHSRRWLLSQLA